ncbi:aldehyde ferredoxin oxidoreductase N-terminal domain-containing protein [Chloroflexota bacterium]
MAELFGWVGKILKVDLTSGAIKTVPTSNYVPKFIGGRALAAKLYWDEVPPDCGAFDPENRLIFASGPASGTLGAASSRTSIVAKSPETIPECYMYSTTGGHWSAELKFAGFDAVVVSGKAPGPVYIWIHDGEVEILKAERLWGLPTSQAETEIRRLWGDRVRSMIIGPAGENLVRSAVILNDFAHATGLGGAGAVMGSKNLKAIAVRGAGAIKIARPKELIDIYDRYVKIGGKLGGGPYSVSSECYPLWHSIGVLEESGIPEEQIGKRTEDIDTYFNNVDSYWVKYWLGYEEKMAGTLKYKFHGCFACPACCTQAIQPVDPTGKEEAPKDLNPPMTIGTLCHELQYQSEWEARVFAGKRYGRPTVMDSSSHQEMGTTTHIIGDELTWFKELVEAGLLTPENTGLPIGDYAACNTPAMIGKDGYVYGATYRSNDFFKRLAEGQIRFLEGMAKESAAGRKIYEGHVVVPRYHASRLGHHTIGEFNAVDMIDNVIEFRDHPNSAYGLFTGGGKSMGNMLPRKEIREANKANRAKFAPLFGPKSFDLPGEDKTFEGKVPVAIFFQNVGMETDSIPLCRWAAFPKFYSLWTPDHLADVSQVDKMLAAITGIDRTMEENVVAMGVAFTLERAIHVREGRRREHDWYTDAVFERNTWTSKDEFSRVLDDYYTARGWDVDTGIPKRSMLEELDMKDVADDLESKYGVKVPA